MSRKSFLQGAAILALAGVIVRIIGALYRIPLTNILGSEGVGLYQLAYPVYGLLLTLSTAGVPGAISKMVSERMVHHDRVNAQRVFRVSLVLLSIIGLLSSIAMAMGSGMIANMIAPKSGPLAQPSMLAAAPALFFVAVITAYRGYFQGLQNMTPTAISQIWEQVVKIFPGFLIAGYLNRYGVEYGAAGAMWGVVLSEVVALVYLMITYSRKKRLLDQVTEEDGFAPETTHTPEPYSLLAKRLTRLALPMVAGAIFLPLAALGDAAIVMNQLSALGWEAQTTRVYYGILSGVVNVLVNVPSVLSLSLSTSLIPAIAESRERRDFKSVERKSRIGLRITMLVSLPSAVGLAVLSKQILSLLFSSAFESPEQLVVGASLLVTSSISVIFLSIVQSTNGTLQGLGKVYVPMVSLAVGAMTKIVLNYILIGIPAINIHGAPIGTIVCYLIPAIINLFFLKRAAGIRLDFSGMLIRPGLASIVMGAAAWAIATFVSVYIGTSLSTVIAVIVAIPLYAVCAVLFGALGREEMAYIPGGGKLTDFLDRHKLLRG